MKRKGRNNGLSMLIGLAAVEAYRFYKGKGVFNKIRYSDQHEAVGNYVEAHYPGAFYSGIVKTEEGWSCIITSASGRVALYFTKTDDGTFVFWEKPL